MVLALYRVRLRAVLAGLLARGARGGSRAPKLVLVGLFVAYVAGSIALAMGLLFSVLITVFQDTGQLWIYFALYGAVQFALGVLGSVFVAAGQVFGATDNETLLSLPIRPGQILVSRILVLLTVEWGLSIPLFLPVAYVWLSAGHTSTTSVAMLLGGFVLLPVVTLSVSLLLAWVLSAVIGRVRRFRNALTLVVALGFLVGFAAALGAIQGRLGDVVLRGVEGATAFSRAMPPFYAFGVAMAELDPVRFAEFLAWVLGPFAVVFWLLSSRYRRILTTSRGAPRVAYRPRPLRGSRVTVALTRKELSHYWNRPMVVLNATIGSIMALFGTGALFVQRERVVAYSESMTGLAPGLTMPIVAAVGIALVGSTNVLSASLVSLEGRSLWIARSLPVESSAIIRAKVVAHLVVSSVPCLLASVVTAGVLADDPGDWLLIVLAPQCFLALAAFGGAAVNLGFPRLDWLTEVQVVKQSASALVTLFGGVGIVGGFALAYILGLSRLVSPEPYVWGCAAVCAVSTLGVDRYLRTGGARRFERLPS